MAKLRSNQKAKPAPPPASTCAPAGAGFCAYIGPTIVGLVQNGTIFQGAKADILSGELKRAVEMHPRIASLVVPGETLAEDRVKVKTPGNLLYVNYQRLASGRE